MKTTKEKLIDSALKLFNEKGFEKTSTTSICTDAGFSSGALFVHFKTKNDLLDYIYIDIKKKNFEYVFSNITNELSVREKMEIIIQKSIEYYMNNLESFAFVKNFCSSIHVSRIAKEEVEKETKGFCEVYKEGVNAGIFIEEDFELIGSMVGGMFFPIVDYAITHKGKGVEKSVELVMKVILK